MEDPSSMFLTSVQSNQMGLLGDFPQSEIVPPSGRKLTTALAPFERESNNVEHF